MNTKQTTTTIIMVLTALTLLTNTACTPKTKEDNRLVRLSHNKLYMCTTKFVNKSYPPSCGGDEKRIRTGEQQEKLLKEMTFPIANVTLRYKEHGHTIELISYSDVYLHDQLQPDTQPTTPPGG